MSHVQSSTTLTFTVSLIQEHIVVALLRRLFLAAIVTVIACAAATFGYLYWSMTKVPLTGALPASVTVKTGDTIYIVADTLLLKDVRIIKPAFTIWARITGDASRLKAGTYQITENMTVQALLTNITQGKSQLSKISIVEGWTFRKMRETINAHPDLIHRTQHWTDAQILEAVGADYRHPEGLFYPDTYHFAPESSDLTIYKQSYDLMQKKMEAAWAARDPTVPYQDIYEALILASLVEKETGHPDDRAKIAGVFVNRIHRNMKLQSDPTVIYGMGDSYNGNIRKKDLHTDTPYNTYTRFGLPPTPIALPGIASLEAALRPEKTTAIFFVAKGDGTGMSHFSEQLKDHNVAVDEYWQRRRENASRE
jgi:UPF0755 protein